MAFFDGPDIGKRVAHYRRLNGWTMDELVANVGGAIGKSVIANLETGRRQDVTVSQLMALADALGVPPVALLLPVEQPFERIEIGGWNRNINSLRHAFAGDGALSPTDTTPGGRRAVRLIISADQLEENLLRISMGLSRLAEELSESRLKALLVNPSLPKAAVSTSVGEDLADDAWELMRDIRTYMTLRSAFEDLGGEGAPEAPWESWMAARFGNSGGAASDSAE